MHTVCALLLCNEKCPVAERRHECRLNGDKIIVGRHAKLRKLIVYKHLALQCVADQADMDDRIT